MADDDHYECVTAYMKTKDELLNYAKDLPENSLRIGLEFVQNLPLEQLEDLTHQYYAHGSRGIQEYIIRTSLESLQSHPKYTQAGGNLKLLLTAQRVAEADFLPSFFYIKDLVKQHGSTKVSEMHNALKCRIKQNIKERFLIDTMVLIPIFLGLVFLDSALNSECTAELYLWLWVNFGIVASFCALRPLRIIVLNCLP